DHPHAQPHAAAQSRVRARTEIHCTWVEMLHRIPQADCRALRNLFFADLQHSKESFLRYVHFANALHALLAFFLLLEQLALAADVAAVALRDDVLAHGGNGGARDDLRADRGLNGNFEHLSRDELAHLFDESFAAIVGEVAVHDSRERVHGFARD